MFAKISDGIVVGVGEEIPEAFPFGLFLEVVHEQCSIPLDLLLLF